MTGQDHPWARLSLGKTTKPYLKIKVKKDCDLAVVRVLAY
jgi:hypothetical protein